MVVSILEETGFSQKRANKMDTFDFLKVTNRNGMKIHSFSFSKLLESFAAARVHFSAVSDGLVALGFGDDDDWTK